MEPRDLKPYKWLNETVIYNKNYKEVPTQWLEDNADVIVLLFSANKVDKGGIIEKFKEIYENVKFLNIPIEVIYVPLEETEESSVEAYENQANWFTIKFDDPMVLVLKFMYGITCIPHLLVIKPDGSIVTDNGIRDLEEYGKNAIITWISRTATITKSRRFSKELEMYGEKWKYLHKEKKKEKVEYRRRFTVLDGS